VKVSGSRRYVYRAVEQDGQAIDVFASKRRDLKAAAKFFTGAISSCGAPAEITTDRAHALVRVVSELMPDALHDTTQYANIRVEADHGRLQARLRPMRGLKRERTARVVSRGHAFIQNLRRGHYDGCPSLADPCGRVRRACAGGLKDQRHGAWPTHPTVDANYPSIVGPTSRMTTAVGTSRRRAAGSACL